jgi:hypothetical protein
MEEALLVAVLGSEEPESRVLADGIVTAVRIETTK